MERNRAKEGSPNGGPLYSKPELLAPAGELSSLKAAVAAGADAVYLGGDRFGARAYARNFDDEELKEAIRFAHLRGVRVYLTLNTLIKESEYRELEEYIRPLDAEGLDAIIIQDMGVVDLVADTFPDIAIHLSTQAAVTGARGAELFKRRGVSRVVPARELSLDELKRIKAETGLETEAFIHGAMCYSCSGMCLFSAMIGGRSGNRGRCGGACRLPYTEKSGELSLPPHPLSMRDMCALPILQSLIAPADGGGPVIDSLKIEGRMKDPVYAAGVTDVYRRAIDEIAEAPDRPYEASERDIEILKGLYLRDDICEGYFFKRFPDKNGPDMITSLAPGYNGTDGAIKESVEERFLKESPRVRVRAALKARVGSPLELTLAAGDGVSASARGPILSRADRRPSDAESLKKQLDRFGGSDLEAAVIEADTDGESFVPASAVNGLRRQASDELTEKLIGAFVRKNRAPKRELSGTRPCQAKKRDKVLRSVAVETEEQLRAVLELTEPPKRLYIPFDVMDIGEDIKERLSGSGIDIFAALPHILRDDGGPGPSDIRRVLSDDWCGLKINGALVRNYEELGVLDDMGYGGTVVIDIGIPAWNSGAVSGLLSMADELTWSPELRLREIEELAGALPKGTLGRTGIVVYGRVPMMVSANCVKKTAGRCDGPGRVAHSTVRLRDRKGNILPVECYCRTCFNVVRNAYPTSLFQYEDDLVSMGIGELRTELTTENRAEAEAALEKRPLAAVTAGRFLRGVE